jgi:hypothetical protein
MSKWLKAVSVWLFGILVAAALAVGTRSAFAQSVTLTCPDDGNGRLGSCANQAECKDKCDAVHGVGNSIAHCSGTPGCCTCLF